MSFDEQIYLEVVKGGFLLLGLLTGGWVVGRAVEKFKREQETLGDLRRMQYEALGRLMRALARFETAFELLHHKNELHRKDGEVISDEELDAATREYEAADEALRLTINAEFYLVGADAANVAIEVSNHYLAHLHDEELDDAFEETVSELRAPLLALLPPLPERVDGPSLRARTPGTAPPRPQEPRAGADVPLPRPASPLAHALRGPGDS
jgi:hypothetical protein